ncbi:DUF4082 domain-containing protein [Promicromonospora sukumoe]|uniref:DUF4082 domain-containing protein n=1 Tax=Promicromonospora sukumoe TaxID=88382 RepID=UPI000360E95F|nr:DUF4082 domain-containing protein [Promicromonospora sukumoe]
MGSTFAISSHRTRRARRSLAAFVVAVLAGSSALLASVPAANAADPCAPGSKPVVCENSKPGTSPEVWDIDRSGDASIQGFATEMSVDTGSRVSFKIDTDARAYTIDIYRTGWYQGLGARKIASISPSATLPQRQPECAWDETTELVDCGSWGVSAGWDVPSTAVSGVYIALLTRTDTGGQSHITFVVRDDGSTSDIVFQTSDTTWQAYNTYGGSSFYTGGANGRAYKLSYNRPFATRGLEKGRDFYFSAEYAMVRFLEQNGYDVTYIAGVDTDRDGGRLLDHKAFLSVGHDEYWSGPQRAAVERARDAGVHLGFFAGNDMYWRTRWEPSVAGQPSDHRTLVSYKETWNRDKIDPSSEWTGTWRDPRYASSAAGAGRPENGVIGTLYTTNYSDLPLTVTSDDGKLRIWRGTTLGSLPAGTSQALAQHTVGYESNEDLDNGFRPAGLIRMSTTVGNVPEYLQDFGNTVAPGVTKHTITMYRAGSGALVFSAGTVQWAWGLDQTHDGDGAPADSRMRQATVNLFADMGVQPNTLASGITPATKTTDTTGPTTQITSPAAGQSYRGGASVTVKGTATDAAGRVAGVEVSLDGGKTWHPAEGRASWQYTGQVFGSGAVQLRARAIDDSANIGAVATVGSTVTCPCTVFGTTTPPNGPADDSSAVELGMRFVPSSDGYVSGVRFHKTSGNTGTHTGYLWSASGQQLASVRFTGETATGWQEASFTSPVPVISGQSYVVSYTAPNGGYTSTPWAFQTLGREAGPLSVPGGFTADPSGLYGSPGTVPTQNWDNAAYWVDPVYTVNDSSPLVASARTPVPGEVSVRLDSPVRITFSKAVVASSVGITLTDEAGQTAPGTVAYDASTRTATFTPSSALAGFATYRVAATARTADGTTLSDGGTWSFRTLRPPSAVCPCGLFDETTVPGTAAAADTAAVVLGTRFSPRVSGKVLGLQFWKSTQMTGPFVATLWGPSGQVVATATVSEPVAQGWQDVTFSTPADVTAGQEYTVGYRAPSGRYPVTLGALGAARTVGDLTMPQNGGVYTYGTGRPTTQTSTSYSVDVQFEPAATTPAVVSRTPSGGAVDVATGTKVSVTTSQPLATSGTTLTLAGPGNQAVSGSLAVSGTTATLTPGSALQPGTAYTASFTGRTTGGQTIAASSWSFTTKAADGQCPCTIFGSDVPPEASADDGAAVELGTRFSANRAGFITAVRFYRGPANTGTQAVSVWSSSGTRLATAQAPSGGSDGWQTVTLPQRVAVTAGTTFTVSYLAPNGGYAAGSGYFSQSRTVGPLTAPANAGTYLYGGGYPQFTWQSTGYWVDPVFTDQ